MSAHRSANTEKAGGGCVNGKGLEDGRERDDTKSPNISSVCGQTHCWENELFFIPSISPSLIVLGAGDRRTQ